MKRFTNYAVSAALTIAIGVLIGAVSHRVAPELTPQVNAQVEAAAEAVRDEVAPLMAMLPEPVKAVADRVADAVAPQATPAVPGAPVVLLSEPVIILGATPAQNTALPRGTQVALLSHRGQYVQVQHQSKVITIPRSATVNGIARLN